MKIEHQINLKCENDNCIMVDIYRYIGEIVLTPREMNVDNNKNLTTIGQWKIKNLK